MKEGRICGIYGVWDNRAPGDLIKGNGKTLTAVYWLYKDYLRGYKCYANIDTTFTDKMTTAEVYELFKDSKAKNIAILLDELQKDMNSIAGYTPTSAIVEFCNIAAAQTRKRNINLYWTTQRALDIPKRARVQTDYLLHPVRFHADNTKCVMASCSRRHYIKVYSFEPYRINPIVTLDCNAVGKLYDSSQVLTDKMVDA